jgi:hypothetical protein
VGFLIFMLIIGACIMFPPLGIFLVVFFLLTLWANS